MLCELITAFPTVSFSKEVTLKSRHLTHVIGGRVNGNELRGSCPSDAPKTLFVVVYAQLLYIYIQREQRH
ncbi:hypothetical protein OUZ56_015200 [Daphnia magna]|uniref:Uncharacterized protein n=1 Tax=Daphnia magna TaxID=35525 RepID=A0ABR0AM41_9CRUS|nr:hypothetical protein OUZ56_015200 [Daphnia magna]